MTCKECISFKLGIVYKDSTNLLIKGQVISAKDSDGVCVKYINKNSGLCIIKDKLTCTYSVKCERFERKVRYK